MYKHVLIKELLNFIIGRILLNSDPELLIKTFSFAVRKLLNTRMWNDLFAHTWQHSDFVRIIPHFIYKSYHVKARCVIPIAVVYPEVCCVWLLEYIISTNILRSLNMIFFIFQVELSLQKNKIKKAVNYFFYSVVITTSNAKCV